MAISIVDRESILCKQGPQQATAGMTTNTMLLNHKGSYPDKLQVYVELPFGDLQAGVLLLHTMQ